MVQEAVLKFHELDSAAKRMKLKRRIQLVFHRDTPIDSHSRPFRCKVSKRGTKLARFSEYEGPFCPEQKWVSLFKMLRLTQRGVYFLEVDSKGQEKKVELKCYMQSPEAVIKGTIRYV